MNLHEAVRAGDADRVRRLLDCGPKAQTEIDARAEDEKGRTPLGLAAAAGHTEVAALLLERGALVSAADPMGITPLLLAARSGHAEIVALLLDCGAEVDAPGGPFRWAPLHLAAWAGHTGTVRVLLDRGADVAARCSLGWTALQYAVREGHTEIAALLLEQGADVNARDAKGGTPLSLAAFAGQTEAVALLLDHGADIEVQVSDGVTPLMLAASNDHGETAALLRARGAGPSAPGATYSGGDGSSIEEAVVIEAASEEAGIGAEYLWLRQQFGPITLRQQGLLNPEGKPFDRMDIETADGSPHTVYFEISSFFGKMAEGFPPSE